MIEAGPSLGPVCVSRREGGGRSCSSLNISCVLVESCKECRNYSLAGSVEPSSHAAVLPRAQQPPSEAGRVLPAGLGSELAPASSPWRLSVPNWQNSQLLGAVGVAELGAEGFWPCWEGGGGSLCPVSLPMAAGGFAALRVLPQHCVPRALRHLGSPVFDQNGELAGAISPGQKHFLGPGLSRRARGV